MSQAEAAFDDGAAELMESEEVFRSAVVRRADFAGTR